MSVTVGESVQYSTGANHRYVLRRSWPGDGGVVNFIMFNPSTADDLYDDPTIRRCIGFAKRWAFSGLVVTNLFAYRATQPKDLKALLGKPSGFRLAIGNDNTDHIDREAKAANVVVCAWGDNVESLPEYVREYPRDVMRMIQAYRALHCIRYTLRGNPAHPVRERYTYEPQYYVLRAKP